MPNGKRSIFGYNTFRCDALRCDEGLAALEFALIAPVFLAILFGIIVYGIYFAIWIAITEAASEGARASVAGLDSASRVTAATSQANNFLKNYGPFLDPSTNVNLNVKATSVPGADGSANGAVQVKITYQFSAFGFSSLAGILPIPSTNPTASVTVSNGDSMSGIDIVFLGLLVLVLIPVATTDLKERRIPNSLNLLIGFLGFAHAMAVAPDWRGAAMAIFTAMLAGLAFAATAWLVQRIDRNARIGWGDLKFLTAASLWVGIDGSVAVLFVVSVVSLLIALATAPWTRASWRQPRPFGPMLAIGMMTVVIATFTMAAQP